MTRPPIGQRRGRLVRLWAACVDEEEVDEPALVPPIDPELVPLALVPAPLPVMSAPAPVDEEPLPPELVEPLWLPLPDVPPEPMLPDPLPEPAWLALAPVELPPVLLCENAVPVIPARATAVTIKILRFIVTSL